MKLIDKYDDGGGNDHVLGFEPQALFMLGKSFKKKKHTIWHNSTMKPSSALFTFYLWHSVSPSYPGKPQTYSPRQLRAQVYTTEHSLAGSALNNQQSL